MISYLKQPTPHLLIDPLVEPSVYERLAFPSLTKRPGGRIGRDLYAGEEGYDDLVQSDGWREIHSRFTSEAFIQEVAQAFSADMEEHRCVVRPGDLKLRPYAESREETETSPLSTDAPAGDLFVRFDFQAADLQYDKGVHVDWPRRLFGGVLYFCSAEEEGLEGGDFGLYRDRAFADDRVCHDPELVVSYHIRHNMGVMFLNCNTGFHGPTPIRKISGLRKWVYCSISSRRDAWPFVRTDKAEKGHYETKPS